MSGLFVEGEPIDRKLLAILRHVTLCRVVWQRVVEVKLHRKQRAQARCICRGQRSTRVVSEGIMMELDLSDLHDYLMYDTIRSGRVPEPATASVIQSLLSSGDVFVDIGANNGYFSLIAARQVGPSGKVYSFEPTPPTYTKLVRNLTINGMNQVRSHELAIGSVGGVGQLTQSDVESGLNTLLDRGEMSIAVRVATLDSVLGNQRVDLMKIDVEGSELEVLEGMSTVLASNRNLKLIIEWNPRYAEEKLFKVLAENFQIHCLAFSVNRTFYKRVAKVQEIPGFCNLFCTRGADAPATLFHSVRTS